METINSRIKKRREELGLSMKQLADRVGVSAWQTVQQWEKDGGTAPKRTRMEAVSIALETSLEYLQFGVSDEELAELGGPELLRKEVAAVEGEIKEILDLTRVIKSELTLEGAHVGYAFDQLLTTEQKEAVVALLRAFGSWQFKGDKWEMLKHIPSDFKAK